MWKKFLNGNNRINNYKVIIVYIYKSSDGNSDIFTYTEVSNSKTNTTQRQGRYNVVTGIQSSSKRP